MKIAYLFCLLSFGFLSTLSAGPVAVRLASQPKKALTISRNGDVTASENRPRKFELVPGLLRTKDSHSLEVSGSSGHYIRHQNGVVKVHKRPSKVNLGYEGDATWKVIRLDGGKVRFESMNYPGNFISVRSDGAVLKSRNPLPEESIFLLTDQ